MDDTLPTIAWPTRAQPRVTHAGRFTQASRGFAEDHVLAGSTCIHLFSYEASMIVAGYRLQVAPGDLVITPAGAEQRFDIRRPGVHWCVRFEPPPPGPRMMAIPIHHRLGGDAVAARRRMELVSDDLRRSAGDADGPAAQAAGAGTHALLCWLASRAMPAPERSRADLAVAKALAILRNLENAAVPIAEIARRVGMSQNRLAQAFLARHGVGMAHYRARHLIAEAQWMMESTDLSLAAIRRRIEIPDAQRFNKLFRRMTGLSPRRWLEARPQLMTSSPRPPIPARRRPVESQPPGRGSA